MIVGLRDILYCYILDWIYCTTGPCLSTPSQEEVNEMLNEFYFYWDDTMFID